MEAMRDTAKLKNWQERKREFEEKEEDRKRRKKTAGSKKLSRAVKLQGDKNGAKADKLQYIVRDVIFYIGKHRTFIISVTDCNM